MSLAVLSPYPIPAALAGKRTNLGDGFILKAVERFLGWSDSERVFSPRLAPGAAERSVLENSTAVILAGANQLNDNYRVWPGLTAEELRASRLVLIPFGIGIHGMPGWNDGMSEETRRILEVMHERIELSAWRCPRTVDYLARHLPALRDRMVLTGCPVMFDAPLLEGDCFEERDDVVVATVTERGAFWERERTCLEWVAQRFRRSRKLLVVHQDYRPDAPLEAGGAPDDDTDQVLRLRRLAHGLGYQMLIPRTPEEGLAIYRKADLHVGSRLHAHLLMLSLNKRSFLIPVDGRASGMAELLDFPLCNPHRLDDALSFDFERVRTAARRAYPAMTRFLDSIQRAGHSGSDGRQLERATPVGGQACGRF